MNDEDKIHYRIQIYSVVQKQIQIRQIRDTVDNRLALIKELREIWTKTGATAVMDPNFLAVLQSEIHSLARTKSLGVENG